MITTLSATSARVKLDELLDEVANSHKPLLITGKRGNALLLAEDDWNAIDATLHLLSTLGMGDSIRDGLATGFEACSQELDW